MDFQFAATGRHWWAAEFVGKGITELITEGLVNGGTYRVVDRKWLAAILEEQKLSSDDPGAEKKMAGVANILGAQYLVVGSVTRFGTEKETKGGGGVGLLYIGKRKGKALVGITARIVDVKTGEVMASVQGEGISTREGLLVVSPAFFAGYTKFSSEYRDTILGEATEIAVKQIVEKLVAEKSRLTGW